MEIKFENIILRDMIESDIEDYVRWFTTETEWSKTDAPWEPIESDAETERASWQEYYESVKDLPKDVAMALVSWLHFCCLENSFRIGLLELLKAGDVLGFYCLAQLEQFFLNCRISEYHHLPCSFEITVVVSTGLNKSSLCQPCVFILRQNILVLVREKGKNPYSIRS